MHTHHFVPSKRGNFEKCDCGERFPCEDRTCGHLDCVAARDTTGCHICEKAIRGAQASCSGDTIKTAELPFVIYNGRGRTRAAHWECYENHTETVDTVAACG